ncbi:MAG: flagellar hook-length control protein FliK [Alphaproteobacteria bacterium]|nr:flagellar hook-length control protein FliK [Alphaproteobacteria bacterium]
MLLPASDIISVLASASPAAPGAAVDAALAASGGPVPQPGQISSTQLFTQLLQGTLLTGISAGALPEALSADGGAAATQSAGEASGDGQGQGEGQQQAGVLAWLFPVAALAAPPAEQALPVMPSVDQVTLTPAAALQAGLPETPQLPVADELVAKPVTPAAVQPALPDVVDTAEAPVPVVPTAPARPRDLMQELLAHIKSVPHEASPEKALQKIQDMLSSSSDVDVEALLQKILASAATAQQPKPLQALQVAEKVAAEAPVQALAVLPAVKTAVPEISPSVRQVASASVTVQDADTPIPVPAAPPVPQDLADMTEKLVAEPVPAEPKQAKAHEAFKPVTADKPLTQVTDALLRQVVQVLNAQPQAAPTPTDAVGDQGGVLSFSASNGPDLSAIAGALADRLSQLDAARSAIEHARPAHHAANVAEQVAVRITQGVREGANQIQIRLEPQDLGRVDVRLDVAADGKASVTVIASSRDALEALQAGSRHLEKALTDAGLKTDSGSLSFSYRGDSQNQQGFAGQMPQLGQYRSPAEEAAAEVVQEVTLSYRPEHNRELDIKV